MAAKRSPIRESYGMARLGAPGQRGWDTIAGDRRVSRAIRCRRGEWYLVRAPLADGADPRDAELLVEFLNGGQVSSQRRVRLHALNGDARGAELLGWLPTPEETTHLRLSITANGTAPAVAGVALHPVAERDPKCHPLANVPRWSEYRPPFTLRRVVLPGALRSIASHLAGLEIEELREPVSRAGLARAARGAACVLDPRWVTDLGLRWPDIEALAASSWLLVDLGTLARLVRASGAADAEVVTHASPHGIMSARVAYADVPTRGFALQDVVPYCAIDARGRFSVRALKNDRAWRSYADDVGFATLLSAETPWERKHGDVLSALRAVGGGELMATDLPWLVAGDQGRLLAPRVAAHLLRMHLGLPIADHVQYWNRWGDANTLVRDIGDLPARYPPLRAVRWGSGAGPLAHLGITLPAASNAVRPHCIMCTGRIDDRDDHDGLPPEPMIIFMKALVREAREGTAWARGVLASQRVTWQFDTAEGLKFAAQYDAAEGSDDEPVRVVHVRMPRVAGAAAGDSGAVVRLAEDEGLYGDGSLGFQHTLTARLRRVLESAASEASSRGA